MAWYNSEKLKIFFLNLSYSVELEFKTFYKRLERPF